MLLSLHIENFALVDELDLQLGAGLNVLTGETGAGKSILLDALDAALGGKVTGRAVRSGAERGLIEARFEGRPEISEWLAAQEIDPHEDSAVLVCSRELTAGKGGVRGRSRVNGMVVNKQQMESLRDRLVEITAQGQTVQLGQTSIQRDWLDGFGGAAHAQQRTRIGNAYEAFQTASKALERRRQNEQERLQQLDLFAFQAQELRDADLGDADELDQLQQERNRLTHAVELQQQSYEVYQALYQNESGNACADLLGKAEQILSNMAEVDSQLQSILDLVTGALTQVEESGREINAYGEGLETDPERLDEVETRIRQLKQICRKYGPSLAEAIALSQDLQQQLDQLSGDGQSVEALEKAYTARQTELAQACAKLTQLRQAAARRLEAMLVDQLKPLAMEQVQFKVKISPASPSPTGGDRIVFLFSPNPGEPLQPLADTASGGEMSRFLLALKVCLSQADEIGTMVFDEIDVGVSGRVAQAIALKLYQLSLRHQVLCVTHQPLVAAMAAHHFNVNKQQIDDSVSTNGSSQSGTPRSGSTRSDKGKASEKTSKSKGDDVRTVVRVTPLDENRRKEELAQLAGGHSEGEAIAFAESLLSQAASTRHEASAALSAQPSSENPIATASAAPSAASPTSSTRSSKSASKRKAKRA
ncbi:MAG: DNA repair protein RecN [Elainellaceae cyanobacterium]